jgi:hypothetical protein
VKDNSQHSGALDPDRPAPNPPEDARSPSVPEVLSPQPQPHPALSHVSQLTFCQYPAPTSFTFTNQQQGSSTTQALIPGGSASAQTSRGHVACWSVCEVQAPGGPRFSPELVLKESRKRGVLKPREAEPCKYRLYAIVVHIGNIVSFWFPFEILIIETLHPSDRCRSVSLENG